jgi:glycosyltransferase involved in cell wall biosynthesis
MISVIIPLYNKCNSISSTISSVLSQTFQNFEIIVVNDGSTDNGASIVSGIEDNRITIINQENNGVSSARNNGITKANSAFIALLDADDLWCPSFLDDMSKFILEYPNASLYGCGYSFQNAGSNIISTDLGLPVNFKGVIDYFENAKSNTLFTSSSVVFKKQDFIEIGGFDARLSRGEDIDLWIKFALYKQVAFYNKSLVIYKLDTENRAFNTITSKEKCLIWNLDRYKQFELSNSAFKEFLDNWRLAHVHNYLIGASTEVSEIYSILKDIDLKHRSVLWTILRYTPKMFQRSFYRIWLLIKRSKK